MTVVLKQDDEIDIDTHTFKLPSHFKKFRRAQFETAELAKDMFESGIDIVVIEASVGFGKSLMLEMLRQWMKKRMLYVAPHIELMRQFTKSFFYAKLLMGRSNYPHGGPNGESDFRRGITCADCRGQVYCRDFGCPNKQDKFIFQNSGVGVTNMAYWLAAANYLNMFQPGTKERKPGAQGNGWTDDYITAFDEGDCLERVMLGFFQVDITQNFLKAVKDRCDLRLSIPIPPVGDFDMWPAYWADVCEMMELAIKKIGEPNPRDLLAVRWYNRLCKKRAALSQVDLDWIYDPVRPKNAQGRRSGPAYKVTLKPIQVGELGKQKLWDHCGQTVVTSGSIIDIDTWKESVGLDKSKKKIEFIRKESDWDPKRRSIHRVSGIKVVKENKALSWSKQSFWPEYVKKISWILTKYPHERCLIHTVSHDLAEELGTALQLQFGKRIIVNRKPKENNHGHGEDKDTTEFIEYDSEKKNKALAQYIAQPFSVLVTASASRGIDLPDDLCRNIIIAKCPFANLGDRGVAARLKTEHGEMWYMVQAVMEIVQSCGRGCRHKDDWVRIWVVDDKFDSIVEMRGLIPPAFAKSIRTKDDFISKFPPTNASAGFEGGIKLGETLTLKMVGERHIDIAANKIEKNNQDQLKLF